MHQSSPGLFEGLSPEELEELQRWVEPQSFPVGTTLLRQGDTPRGLYIVQEGTADIFLSDQLGREHRINQVGPGSTLGEMSLITGQPVSATVRATTRLEVLALSEAGFNRIATAYPRIL